MAWVDLLRRATEVVNGRGATGKMGFAVSRRPEARNERRRSIIDIVG